MCLCVYVLELVGCHETERVEEVNCDLRERGESESRAPKIGG